MGSVTDELHTNWLFTDQEKTGSAETDQEGFDFLVEKAMSEMLDDYGTDVQCSDELYDRVLLLFYNINANEVTVVDASPFKRAASLCKAIIGSPFLFMKNGSPEQDKKLIALLALYVALGYATIGLGEMEQALEGDSGIGDSGVRSPVERMTRHFTSEVVHMLIAERDEISVLGLALLIESLCYSANPCMKLIGSIDEECKYFDGMPFRLPNWNAPCDEHQIHAS